MQRRAAEESLTDHGKDNSNGRAHVGDAIRHKPGILGFLRADRIYGSHRLSKREIIALPEALRGPRDLPRTHRPIECLTNMRASGEASTAQTHTRRASVNSVSSPQ